MATTNTKGVLMKKAVLICLTLFVLGGCATSHMIKSDVKPEIAAKPGSATLVIIRDTHFGGGIVFWNYLDGKLIGETMGKTYFITGVPPGPHYVVAASENTGVARFDFKPGKVYFLGQNIAMGVWRARVGGFYPMNRQEAAEAMKNCSYTQYDPAKPGGDMAPDLYKKAIEEYEAEVKDKPEAFKAILAYDGQ